MSKGSRSRVSNNESYRTNFDAIFKRPPAVASEGEVPVQPEASGGGQADPGGSVGAGHQELDCADRDG